MNFIEKVKEVFTKKQVTARAAAHEEEGGRPVSPARERIDAKIADLRRKLGGDKASEAKAQN